MLVTVPVYTSYCILEVQYIPRLFTFIDDTLSIYCKPFLLFWKSCYIMPLSIFFSSLSTRIWWWFKYWVSWKVLPSSYLLKSRFRLVKSLFLLKKIPLLYMQYTITISFWCSWMFFTLGMPHNQLGTLFWNHHYGCRAAYYYLRW